MGSYETRTEFDKTVEEIIKNFIIKNKKDKIIVENIKDGNNIENIKQIFMKYLLEE